VKIKNRLLLWYLSVALIALPFFSVSTYFGVRHLMLEALESEREAVINAVEGHFDPVSRTFQDLDLDNLWINVDMEESYMVIYDSDGQEIYKSPMADRIRLSMPMAKDEPEIVTILKHDSEEMPVFHPASSEQVRFQAVSRKLYHDNQVVGWLNVATSLDDIDDSLRHLLRILFATKVAALVLLLGGGYVIARKSLEPVAAITGKARRISSSNLGERIEVTDRNDEIGQLAVVLNNLLGRLERAFKSQQQFMADAAHELKTPIAILRTTWEDELNNPELSDTFKERLVSDVETITRLSRIINNLLLLSQTESIEKSFEFASLRLDDLVKDVVTDTTTLAKMKGQQIEHDNIQTAMVKGDRDRLYQLFFNLIDNAVKYTPEGGTITVSLDIDRGSAIVAVRDTGPGIPTIDLLRVFDRFFRVDRDRSRKTGGSGLGLAICKMIAETHQGHIKADSKPGEGAVFTVHLPILE